MVQQGAGMAVTKSDAQHEYASCEFLKGILPEKKIISVLYVSLPICRCARMPIP